MKIPERAKEILAIGGAGSFFTVPGILVVLGERSIIGLFGIPFVMFGGGLLIAAGLRLSGVSRQSAKLVFFTSTVITFAVLAILAFGVAFPPILSPAVGLLGERAIGATPLLIRAFFALFGVVVVSGLALLGWHTVTHPENPPWRDPPNE